MRLNFTKMHGLGNDFIVLNGLEQKLELNAENMRTLADRRTGIGCDQILLLEPSENPTADVRYRIFNADGGEAEQCGNGIRCIAEFLRKRGYVTKDEIVADTLGGIIKAYLESKGNVRVNMGVPRFEPADIPITAEVRQLEYSLDLTGVRVSFSAVSIGNPHAVINVDDIEHARVRQLGQGLQQLQYFPESVNVGFRQILDTGHIRLRVYERGVGETQACGTGACAAVTTGILADRLAERVDVGLKGGHLTITWDGEGEPVWMIGPATTVYEGEIDL